MNEYMSCTENTPGTFTARTETRAVGFLSPRSLGSLKVKGGSPGKMLGQGGSGRWAGVLARHPRICLHRTRGPMTIAVLVGGGTRT